MGSHEDCNDLTNYKQRVHFHFTHLVQGSMSVQYYTENFYNLATRLKFPKKKGVVISMYRQGLNPQILGDIAASQLYNMTYAIEVTYMIEIELQKKAL